MRQKWKRGAALLLALLCAVGLMTACQNQSGESVEQAPSETTSAGLETARYGVMTGSVAEIYLSKTYPDAVINTYSAIPDAFAALSGGKIDYVMTAYTTALTAIRSNGEFYIFQNNVEKDKVACGVAKDNPELLKKLDDVLTRFIQDGTIDRLVANWIDCGDSYVIDDVPESDGRNGTLRVAINADREPMCFVCDNSYRGLDCELARLIAGELGMKVEFQNMQFAGLIAALQSKKADVIISNLVMTEERGQQISFTQSYFDNPQVLVAKGETGQQRRAPAPETARYAVTSVVAQDYLYGKFPNAEFLAFGSAADAALALKSGKVDYMMTSQAIAGYLMKNEGELRITGNISFDEACYIAVSKERAELKESVDAILSKFKADGTLNELCGRWELGGPDYYNTKHIVPSAGENGVLKVAISPDVPPICFMQDGEAIGINIELIELIARELGMTVEYAIMDFSALLPAIQSGQVDMAISDINATDERRELVDFTQSYFDNPQVLLMCGDLSAAYQSGSPEYATLDKLEGKTLACLSGSVYDQLVGEAIPELSFLYYNDAADTLTALLNRKVDGILLDEPVARYMISQSSDVTIIPEYIMTDQYAITLAKNSPLTEQFNNELKNLKADGTRAKLFAKWSGSDASAKKLPDLDYPAPNGTLRIACGIGSEPMVYADSDGSPVGFEVEMVVRIAQALGKKAELITVNFDSIISMLESGKADVAVGSISVTEERRELVDMTNPDYNGGVVVVVRKAASAGGTNQNSIGFFEGLKASFVRTFITENRWKLVLDGLEVTVLVSVCSGVLGSLFGFGICLLRRSKKKYLSLPAAAFIRLIQGTPIVVLLMILYYVIFGKVDISALLVAIFGFAVNFGVYVSEMMRTGIEAVDPGQVEAALALGFTRVKTFLKITFPQAARHFLPIYKGEFISMVKMTSVVGYIAIQDLTKVSDIIRSRTLEAFFPLIATAIIYFLVANLLTLLLSRLEISLDPKRRKRTVKGVIMK